MRVSRKLGGQTPSPQSIFIEPGMEKRWAGPDAESAGKRQPGPEILGER